MAQLREENINLAKKSEREKHDLSSQLESLKKDCENAHKSLGEVQKKNSDIEKSVGKLSKIKTEAV